MNKKLLSALIVVILMMCCSCNTSNQGSNSSNFDNVSDVLDSMNSELTDDKLIIKTNPAVGDVSTGMALSWSYSKRVEISDIKLYFSEKSDMSNAQEYTVSPYSSIHIIKDFETDKEYYWYLQLTLVDGQIEKSDVASATLGVTEGPYIVEIDGVGNTRDIGGIMTESGKMIKAGLLYRSGEMDTTDSVKITESGIKTAIDKLKIKTELDLRRPDQIPVNMYDGNNSPLGKNVNYFNYSAKEYYDFVRGDSNESEIMRVFSDINNYPIIFHCVWGADRTGTVAYLLEMLVGVNEENRIKDYELTGSRDRYYNGFKSLTSGIQSNIKGKTEQEKAYNIFSQNFGLTDMEISNIYNILITDSAIYSSNSLQTPKIVANGEYSFDLIMRNSKSVKNVTYNSKAVKFLFNGNTLTIYGIEPEENSVGIIVFDDGSELRFNL